MHTTFQTLRSMRPFRPTLAALAVSMLLAACGGGGGGSGDGGIGGTGNDTENLAYASGTITGLGSIIVNGVRYDDSAAIVQDDDGTPLSGRDRPRFDLGMQVEVMSGPIDDSTGRATAEVIRLGTELKGPIASVAADRQSFTLLGQTVRIVSTTVFDDSLSGGAAALAAGLLVEVHATYDASTGIYTATRIEDEDDASSYRLRGTVSGLDTTARTFRIGDATISYAGVANVPAGLSDGVRLRVRLSPVQNADGSWNAQSLGRGEDRVRDLRDDDDSDDDSSRDWGRVSLEGRVTAFTSLTEFSIEGIPVRAELADYRDGTSGIGLGVELEVRGRMVDGTLEATRIELEDRDRRGDDDSDDDDSDDDSGGRDDDDGRLELHGTVSNLDTSATTFVLTHRGGTSYTVNYASARFDDSSPGELVDGARLEVYGDLAAGSSVFIATKLEFED